VVLGVFGLLAVVALVVALLDVARTPAAAVRTLPKPVWLLVVLSPFFGPAAWWLAGRPAPGPVPPARRPPERRPPDDDEDFLRQLRKRAEEQRRRARDPRDDPPPAGA
jgi:hypothetical protein